MKIITEGPIIKGQLYVLLGGLLWVAQSLLSEIEHSVSVGLGCMAIFLTSMGMYILMDSRKNRESADETG
jgi:hypothetical protein